jgi:ATPase subunit of ABC transporter with duplicated ATPase domains
VQSRVKALEKIEKIELPKKRQVVQFDFRRPPRSGEEVATLENVSKAYGRRVVHEKLSLMLRRGERWSVMGKNGAGKTTLFEDGRRRPAPRLRHDSPGREPEARVFRPAVPGCPRPEPDGVGADPA